jgi:hypothetical protein
MMPRICVRCDQGIRPDEPYDAHVHHGATPAGWTNYSHRSCPGPLDLDALCHQAQAVLVNGPLPPYPAVLADVTAMRAAAGALADEAERRIGGPACTFLRETVLG